MNEIRKLFLTEVALEVKKPKYTLVLCHRNPDPDTLGSAFALKILLEHFGSRAVVACCDEASKKYDFITGGESLEYKEDAYERIIAVDVASPAQLGGLERLAKNVDMTIDHHSMNTRFSPYFEHFCAACAEIIMELARDVMGVFDELPTQFYNCVYAGISGDTGCFKYSNTTVRTMTYGAELIYKGIDFAEINRIIFDAKTQGEVRAQRLVCEKMELLENGRLALVIITENDKKENNLSENDIADAVNQIRSIDTVKVAISAKEAKNGIYSLSTRSNCELDVACICSSVGGGGHTRAAGARIEAQSENEAREKIIELFAPLVREK